MKWLVAIAVCVFYSSLVLAQETTVRGRLVTDEGEPVPGVKISIADAESEPTDTDGNFTLEVSDDLSTWAWAVVKVDRDGWLINSPLDGKWIVPDIGPEDVPVVDIVIVPAGSGAIWTDARIEKSIAELSDDIAELKEAGADFSSVDLTEYLGELAEEYSLSPQDLKKIFDEWAKAAETSEDNTTIGLREFYNRNFAAAAVNFEKAARKHEQKLEYSTELVTLAQLGAHENWMRAGNAFWMVDEFREALESYYKAEALIAEYGPIPQRTTVLNLIASVAKKAGAGITGDEKHMLLSESAAVYRQVLEIYSQEQSPSYWIVTQGNLADVLRIHGDATEGPEGDTLLAQSAAAYRQILQFGSDEISPEYWAMYQNNLGTVLQSQGERAEDTGLLKEAAGAYRLALSAYKRDLFPEDWAMAQNNLGFVLYVMAALMEGPEAEKALKEAQDAYQQALQVYTLEQFPEKWAMVQSNISFAFQSQWEQAEGPEKNRLLAETVAARRQVLKAKTFEQFPEEWAQHQRHIGMLLHMQGAQSEGAESDELLKDALVAYRQTLLLYTTAKFPEEWFIVQNNLGLILQALGERSHGAKKSMLFADAAIAYRHALQTCTREQFPNEWGTVQNNLGRAQHLLAVQPGTPKPEKLLASAAVAYRNALDSGILEKEQRAVTQLNLGIVLQLHAGQVKDPEGSRLHREAITAYRRALEIYDRDQFSEGWALVNNELGAALYAQAERVGEAQAIELVKEAIAGYHQALKVYTPEKFPRQWITVQENLGRAYFFLKDWANAERHYVDVLQADPAHSGAYRALTGLYHERIFAFQKAFALHQAWLARYPADISALCDFAEAHFTTGRFAECQQRIVSLLVMDTLGVSNEIALRGIEIANLIALSRSGDVPSRLDELIKVVAALRPGFQLSWRFDGTNHFIASENAFTTSREWLEHLFAALKAESRNGITEGLKVALAGFPLKK